MSETAPPRLSGPPPVALARLLEELFDPPAFRRWIRSSGALSAVAVELPEPPAAPAYFFHEAALAILRRGLERVVLEGLFESLPNRRDRILQTAVVLQVSLHPSTSRPPAVRWSASPSNLWRPLVLALLSVLVVGALSYCFFRSTDKQVQEGNLPWEKLVPINLNLILLAIGSANAGTPEQPGPSVVPTLATETSASPESALIVAGDLTIANFVLTEIKGFPVACVTLKNNGEEDLLINGLTVDLMYQPFASLPQYGRIPTIAYWDVLLPFKTGRFQYKPTNPVAVPAGHAATVYVRFYHKYEGNVIVPGEGGSYDLSLTFGTDRTVSATTQHFGFYGFGHKQ